MEHNGIRDQLLVEDANDSGTKVNLTRNISQNVTHIVEANRRQRNGEAIAGLGEGIFMPEDNMTHRARIPLVIAEDWKNKHGWDLMKADLNDPYHKAKLAELMNRDEYKFAITYGNVF